MSVSPTPERTPLPDFEHFTEELETLLNRYSLDAWSDTPDYILADYTLRALCAYRATITDNRIWHGWKTLPERLNQP